MKLKKCIISILVTIIVITCVGCGNTKEKNVTPQVSQMKSICELATIECYYHNVAKYSKENAEGILMFKKDKHFWIEYSGVVKIGIDASLLNIQVADNQVTVTLPPTKVLSSKVDSDSLNKESFYVEKGSAKVTADDETCAYKEAQMKMENAAANDTTLLANAQQRVQTLLEEYVKNISNVTGKEYAITWKYLDTDSTKESAATKTE